MTVGSFFQFGDLNLQLSAWIQTCVRTEYLWLLQFFSSYIWPRSMAEPHSNSSFVLFFASIIMSINAGHGAVPLMLYQTIRENNQEPIDNPSIHRPLSSCNLFSSTECSY